MSPLSDWLDHQLSILLGFPVPEEMITYIMGIENYKDLEDYLKTLLDLKDPMHRQFLTELKKKQSEIAKGQFHAYQKPELKSLDVPSVRKEKKKNKGKSPSNEQKLPSPPPAQNIPAESQGKKKQKFINLYSQEGQAKDIILLKGRHKCNCQASKHKLITNCLKCGRIVCEQEGSGPCLFCGTLVCTWEEQQILNKNTKQSNHLYKKLLESKAVDGLDAAVEQRNRLLEYDKTSARRTKVIDDESDYFSSNSVWLSKGEREKLKKKEEEMRAKRHASRLDKKMTFDFAGRKVIEEDDSGEFCEIEDYNEDMNMSNLPSALCEIDYKLAFPDIFSENMDSVINIESSDKQHDNKWKLEERLYPRIQDRELQEMSDEGYCLSMHQPWASLLVAGIKVHEGRTWYTAHRGRLWIAAAAKAPSQQDIKELEDLYRCLKGDNLKFPSQYPVSCLLGCVNVVDCLPQEEYRAQFPDGECTSPYVFMCEDARELPVRFPIQGKHKIYKLDPKIHQAAQKSLQKFSKIKSN